MVVVIHLFAVARQVAGTRSVTVEVAEPATVATVREALVRSIPALAVTLPHLRMAVDSAYVDDSHAIGPGSEVAVIPPVSGGSLD